MPYFFCFTVPASTALDTLSLHDALPIYFQPGAYRGALWLDPPVLTHATNDRDEEIGRATSELQSPMYLVCRLLLEKKNRAEIRFSLSCIVFIPVSTMPDTTFNASFIWSL